MTIVEFRCPRCAIRRTVRVGHWGGFCFNCRFAWDRPASADAASVPSGAPVQSALGLFGPAELLRLERYRAALQAGLYTDLAMAHPDEPLPSPSATPTST